MELADGPDNLEQQIDGSALKKLRAEGIYEYVEITGLTICLRPCSSDIF